MRNTFYAAQIEHDFCKLNCVKKKILAVIWPLSRTSQKNRLIWGKAEIAVQVLVLALGTIQSIFLYVEFAVPIIAGFAPSYGEQALCLVFVIMLQRSFQNSIRESRFVQKVTKFRERFAADKSHE